MKANIGAKAIKHRMRKGTVACVVRRGSAHGPGKYSYLAGDKSESHPDPLAALDAVATNGCSKSGYFVSFDNEILKYENLFVL